jgi:hypothetical protein
MRVCEVPVRAACAVAASCTTRQSGLRLRAIDPVETATPRPTAPSRGAGRHRALLAPQRASPRLDAGGRSRRAGRSVVGLRWCPRARIRERQRARQRGELLLGERVLVGVALVGEVASDDDEVGRGRVDLLDCGAEKLLAIAAAADVDVGELRDQHRHSLTRPRWPRPAGTGTPEPAHAPPPDRTARHARAGSGTGVPKRDLRLPPEGRRLLAFLGGASSILGSDQLTSEEGRQGSLPGAVP